MTKSCTPKNMSVIRQIPTQHFILEDLEIFSIKYIKCFNITDSTFGNKTLIPYSKDEFRFYHSRFK